MVTIETIATVTEDGTITARVPGVVTRGRHRAVIILEDLPLERGPVGRETHQGFPDMASFRKSLGVASYRGNTILDMREEERG